MEKIKKIAVIGLGYVGLPLAVEFGKRRPVIGFDINSERIGQLRLGKDRTGEVCEIELNKATSLKFTTDPVELDKADIYIVTVPTPIDKNNRPDLGPLIHACEVIGRTLKHGNLVIYESTVYPGATEEICIPILEKASSLKYNRDFFAGYSPERINPGDNLHSLINVKKITSGSTPNIAEVVDSLYKEIIVAGTLKVSSMRVAEAAKVIENSQRDLNIAFVNELSLIFNRMGLDSNEVLDAAATKWNFLPFRPGLVGGHCIGVDPYYLTHKAQQLGYQPQVILAGRRINDDMAIYAAQSFIRLMIRTGINVSTVTVGIMGITFKENCRDTRNSKVIDIVRELQSWGIRIKITDPLADPEEVWSNYGLRLERLTPDAPVGSLLVAVSHYEFSLMKPYQLRALCEDGIRPVIADLKALYDLNDLKAAGFEIFRL